MCMIFDVPTMVYVECAVSVLVTSVPFDMKTTIGAVLRSSCPRPLLISELLCELGTLSSFQCDRCRLLDVLLDMECIPARMICLMFGLPTSHLLPTLRNACL